MQYGEKIAALRKSEGMTQAELGRELSVTFQAVSKWERGESLPDFETMTRIAKLFGIRLEYFGEDAETDDYDSYRIDAEEDEEYEEEDETLMCSVCGKELNDDEAAETEPNVLCAECYAKEEEKRAREQAQKARRIMESKAAKERAAQPPSHISPQSQITRTEPHQENRAEPLYSPDVGRRRRGRKRTLSAEERAARLANGVRERNRGLIGGAIITGILFVLHAIVSIYARAGATYFFMGVGELTFFVYPYVAQLFWDGIVRDVTLAGGKVIGTPGVIFSFDLDGIIFLIGIKILFALLKMLIFLLTTLVVILFAVLISPFTLVPQAIKCGKGELI